MTLKEAYDKAKEGQTIQRKKWTDIGLHGFLKQKIDPRSTMNIEFKDAIADDWEIVSEKKKVVIEGIVWLFSDMGKVIYPDIVEVQEGWAILKPSTHSNLTFLRDHAQLLTKMKMTLEWEE